jgi:hypothetical protein
MQPKECHFLKKNFLEENYELRFQVMIVFTVIDQINTSMDYGKPLGWILSLLPMVFIPIYAIKNWRNFNRRGQACFYLNSTFFKSTKKLEYFSP